MLTPTNWPWTDVPAVLTPRQRWQYFARSGECLTTLFLAAYTILFILPGSTFTRSPAFAWLAQLSHQRDQPYAVMACALALTGPLAVGLNSGTLRILSVVSQAGFFLLFGFSFWRSLPLGFGWATLVLAGLWLLWRAMMLTRHHTRR